jgi:hypothetical protein
LTETGVLKSRGVGEAHRTRWISPAWAKAAGVARDGTMADDSIREPEQIRQDCARKLRSVETSGMFAAILGRLLGEDWSTPKIEEMRITPDRSLLARVEGEVTFTAFLGAEADLIRNVHGVAEVAGLDGDEVGYLLGRIAEMKGIK